MTSKASTCSTQSAPAAPWWLTRPTCGAVTRATLTSDTCAYWYTSKFQKDGSVPLRALSCLPYFLAHLRTQVYIFLPVLLIYSLLVLFFTCLRRHGMRTREGMRLTTMQVSQ